MADFTFVGEESARFTRFAEACLAVGLRPSVSVSGREPLTSRPINLHGILEDAKLEGYIRYIVIQEKQSGLKYWVAGSNATRSIASRLVVYSISEDNIEALRTYSDTTPVHVPRVRRDRDEVDRLLWAIETSLDRRDESGLSLLLSALSHQDDRVTMEAALTLRAYSSFVVESGRRQRATEQSILKILPSIHGIDARVALVEDLGYLGSDDALGPLAQLLADKSEHAHVRWAAAISLGRLPGVDPKSQISPGLDSDLEWVPAATLLSIARHATPDNRVELEPVFREYLGAEKTPLMIRYACLGLSRFDRHDPATSHSLRAVLGDDDLAVHVRGYAALALSATLSNSSQDDRNQTRMIMGRFAKHSQLSMDEPEAIWGVEFLAELASLLELNEVSYALHGLLADNFDDWRSAYYQCMQYYERGESCVRRGLSDDAINAYDRALVALRTPEKGLPAEVQATIQFRRDIVDSRRRLQSLLGSWLDAIGSAELKSLSEAIAPIRGSYRRYVLGGPNIGADRQLVEREINYIKSTSDLVAVIQMLINFDALVRNRAFHADEIPLLLQDLDQTVEAIRLLKGKFEPTLAGSLRDVINTVDSDLQAISAAFSSPHLPLADKLRLARSSMTQVRSALFKASWPMPGRACPVYGLGQATISIRQEGLLGSGTEADPFLFPKGTRPVLLVRVRISEMAPGGSTTLYLEHTVGERQSQIVVPIVEDQQTFSVHVQQDLSSVVPVRCDLKLIFSARDCTQIADTYYIYLKSEP